MVVPARAWPRSRPTCLASTPGWPSAEPTFWRTCWREHRPCNGSHCLPTTQWFYYSHAPKDQPTGSEHGHIYLFARRALWESLSATPEERASQKLCGNPRSDAGARHLIAIGFDAKGLPISLFAVNSWVTGDLMLSADSTAWLLSKIDTDTGHPEIDVVMVSLVRLCQEDIEALLAKRDGTLASRLPKRVLEDRALEILTEIPLNLDARTANALN